MHTIKNIFLTIALGLILSVAALSAHAATTNYSAAVPGVVLIPLQLSGQYTANTTAVVRFALPFPARIVGVTASARASGGTTPTLTVDLLDDGVTVLSAPVSVTAGSVAEGAVSAPTISDESVMTVNLAIGGTSPTWNDITIMVTAVRR